MRGLGKLSGAKGGAVDAGSGRISSSSPRGPTIGARARAVLSGRPRRFTENVPVGQHRGPAQHGRSNSVGGATAVAAEAASRGGAGAGWGEGGGAPFSGAFAASLRGGEASSSQQQRLHPERSGFGNGSNINGGSGGPPALASPAGSSLSLPSSRSSWDMSGAVMGRSRGGGGGGAASVVGVSSKKRPTRVAVAPTARTPTSATLARPDHGWLEGGNKGAAAGDVAQMRDERTPRSRRMSPTGIRGAGFGSSSGAGDNDHSGRTTITASMASPSRRLATVADVSPAPSAEHFIGKPPAAEQQSLLLPVSGSRPRTETTTTSSHRRHGGGGGRDNGGGELDRRHRASLPRAPDHRGSSGGRERERERGLHVVHAVGGGSFEEPLPVTPDFDGGLAARAPRSPPSPAESRTGSRRFARRCESGSR